MKRLTSFKLILLFGLILPLCGPSMMPAYSQQDAAAEFDPAGMKRNFLYYSPEEYGGEYVVRPLDGREPFVVSKSFFETAMRANIPNDNGMLLDYLGSYPGLAGQMENELATQVFPDATMEAGVTVDPMQVQMEDGGLISIADDPYAGPYSRVKIAGADGKVNEFSVSKFHVASMLSHDPSPESLKNSLGGFPHKLPEDMRFNFNVLSPQAFRAKINAQANVQKMAYVKSMNVYRKISADGGNILPPPPEQQQMLTAQLQGAREEAQKMLGMPVEYVTNTVETTKTIIVTNTVPAEITAVKAPKAPPQPTVAEPVAAPVEKSPLLTYALLAVIVILLITVIKSKKK